jgi:hypothetical protein
MEMAIVRPCAAGESDRGAGGGRWWGRGKASRRLSPRRRTRRATAARVPGKEKHGGIRRKNDSDLASSAVLHFATHFLLVLSEHPTRLVSIG